MSITTQQNMVDFDTIDKYVAAVKRGGVAIQMKQFHNLDRFIEEVVYDFKLVLFIIPIGNRFQPFRSL